MEYIEITKSSEKHHFKKGDKLMVKRSIMNECVVIIPDEHTPNTIMSYQELSKYGNITGTPQLCCY